ncbi:MAG: hypothetical protein ABSG15_00570 [FCB group bacterium]|jgi:hypothetical protein
MEDMQKEVGQRLREVRDIFYEGNKLSARLFANTLGETKDNIVNYENGKANIPNRLLIALYYKGFNPIYILTGEGSIFADNERGRELFKIIEKKNKLKGNVTSVLKPEFSQVNIDELYEKFAEISAAAGDIMKAIKKKRK